MFLQAGFNYRHRDTGIRAFTAHVRARRGWAPARLIVFTPKAHHPGDLAWVHNADKPRFLVWGEQCNFRTHAALRLHPLLEWQLESSDLP